MFVHTNLDIVVREDFYVTAWEHLGKTGLKASALSNLRKYVYSFARIVIPTHGS